MDTADEVDRLSAELSVVDQDLGEAMIRENTIWKPLLAAAEFGLRALTADYKQGQHPEQYQRGFMVGKPEYAVDVLRDAIAACKESL